MIHNGVVMTKMINSTNRESSSGVMLISLSVTDDCVVRSVSSFHFVMFSRITQHFNRS